MRRIERVERARYAQQLAVLAGRLSADGVAATDAGARFAATQASRDLARLQAAVDGRTPSAVVHRADDPDDSDAQVRLALARDEAVHTADNALAFLARGESADLGASTTPGPALRAVRWALRLELELADAGLTAQPEVREPALAVVRASAQARPMCIERLRVRIVEIRSALQAMDPRQPQESVS